MLVRHCNRCNRVIEPKENYSSYEEKYYNGSGGYSVQGTFDLCQKCSEELDEFLLVTDNPDTEKESFLKDLWR